MNAAISVINITKYIFNEPRGFMDRKNVEIFFASLTILLTIITIIVFILFGASLLFYAIAIVAIVVALFNGWILSNVENKDFALPFLMDRKNQKSTRNKRG